MSALQDGRQLLLLLLLVLHRHATGPSLANAACILNDFSDGFGSALPSSAGTYHSSSVTLQDCTRSCTRLSLYASGVEKGVGCFCGTADDESTLNGAGTCSSQCSDGGTCGGPDGSISTGVAGVEPSISAPSEMTLDVGTPTSLDLTTTNLDGAAVLVDPGDGSPPVQKSVALSNDGVAMDLTYGIPGTFSVNIVAQPADTTFAGASNSTLVTVSAPSGQGDLTCPLLTMPGVPHSCELTAIGLSSVDYSIRDAAGGPYSRSVSIPSAVWSQLGPAPPMLPIPAQAAGSTGEALVFKEVFSERTLITTIRWMGAADGECTFQLLEGSCASGSGIFCASTGRCSSYCPLVADSTGNFSCAADLPTLCSMGRQCSSTPPGSTCRASSGPFLTPAGAPVTLTTADGVLGVSVPAGPLWAEQGWLYKVECTTGALAYLPAPSGEGNTDHSADRHYLLQVSGAPTQPVALPFTCTDVGPVHMDVTIPGESLLTEYTDCEIPVQVLSLTVEQDGAQKTAQNSPSVNIAANFSGEFYVEANVPLSVTATVQQGSPVDLIYAFGTSAIDNTSARAVEPVAPDGHTETATYPDSGEFYVTVSGSNQHTPQFGLAWSQLKLYVQHPVMEDWTLHNESSTSFLVPAPGEPAAVQFILRLPDNLQLPTNASVDVDFGDDYPGSFDVRDKGLTDASPATVAVNGFFEVAFSHDYSKSDKYSVHVNISNQINFKILTLEVLIEEKILDLKPFVRQQQDDRTVELESGGGLEENEYRNDRNLTFSFEMTQGTIIQVILYNDSNAGHEMLETFVFDDKDDPSSGLFIYHIDFNQELEMSFVAKNTYEITDPIPVTIIIQDPISEITDISIVLDENQPSDYMTKRLIVNWDSASLLTMALKINYGDIPVSACYDQSQTCEKHFPEDSVSDMPTQLQWPMHLEYRFHKEGNYNVTVEIKNDLSYAIYQIVVSVSDLDCRNPDVELVGSYHTKETDPYPATPRYFLSQNMVFRSQVSLTCSVSLITKKRWEVFKMEASDEGESEFIMYDYPNWNKADLIIPPNSLQPGLHQLQYTITMEGMPGDQLYQTVTRGYFIADRTPLFAGMIKGGVNKIIRGWGQQIYLNAIEYSRDPDEPDSKDFTFQWYCSRKDEVLPRNETTGKSTKPAQSIPTSVGTDAGLGGCFGNGPALLDHSSGILDMDSAVMQPNGEKVTFMVTMIVSKDSRSNQAQIEIEMVQGSPPIIEVECADPLLCFPSTNGTTVNVHSRLGLRGRCSSHCGESLTWSWTLSTVSDTGEVVPVSDPDKYLPVSNQQEVGIRRQLYEDHPQVKKFHIGLNATNNIADSPVGLALFFLTVNQPPIVEGKECRCEKAGNTSLAIIDAFSIDCQMPVDPDGDKIEKISFFTTETNPSTGKTVEKMIASQKDSKLVAHLGFEENDLHYVVYDSRRGLSRKTICRITTTLPTKEQYDEFMASDIVMAGPGTGDSRFSAQISQARESVLKAILDTLVGDDLDDALAEMAEGNIKQLETLENMAATDKESQSLVIGTVKSVVGTSRGDPLKLDSRTLKKAVDVMSSVAASLEGGDYATPEDFQAVVESVLDITSMMAKNVAAVTGDETCQSIPVADKRRTATMPFDTEIEIGKKPVIVNRTTEMLCNAKDNVAGDTEDMEKAIDEVIETVQLAVLQRQVLNDEQVIQMDDGSTMLTAIKNPDVFKNETRVGSGSVTLPEGYKPNGDQPVAISAHIKPDNAKTTVEGSESIGKESSVITFSLRNRELKPIDVTNLTTPIQLTVPQRVEPDPARRRRDVSSNVNCTSCPTMVNTTERLRGKLLSVIYSEFNITKPHSAITISVFPVIDATEDIFVMMDFGRMPTLKNHSLLRMLRDFPGVTDYPAEAAAGYSLFMDSAWVDNRMGSVFVGVGQFNASGGRYSEVLSVINAGGTDFSAFKGREVLRSSFTTDYLIRTVTVSCSYYDSTFRRWRGDGLTVVGVDETGIKCNASHLTSFASGLFIEPNTIDFAYVFANASFTDNMTIYMTLILLLTIYVLLLIWAHWQDKKDVQKLGARPLPDNKPKDKYLYEIMAFTGHKSDAATNSEAFFILSGDDDETTVRTFGKPKRQFFRKSGQDAFVMSVPRPLGALQYIRIWHDNSGSGRFASWFLQYLLIRDVQTGEMTTFVCNRWLAVEYEDGVIDRVIPVAGKEQLRDFSHIFPHTSQTTLSDGHLWFSVFLRPPRSRFTRKQRVSAAFSLLFLSMMVNAMWYETVPSKPNTSSLKFGPLTLSPEQIAVGVISNIIVFIPSMLIVFLFRKARPRHLRESRIDLAMKKVKEQNSPQSEQSLAVTDTPEDHDKEQSTTEPGKRKSSAKKNKGQKRKFSLPWWCVIVGWIICVICLFGSAFIVWAYGVKFGNEKATKWITSLFISFFSSILLIQPLKVFLTAMLISAIFKNVDLGSDDANEDERDPRLAADEEWDSPRSGSGRKRNIRAGCSYDNELIKKMRKQRQNEVEMGIIIREILSYAFFLWILFILSYDNRDPNAFLLQQNLRNAFIKEGDITDFTTYLDFSEVKNNSGFWHWSRNVILQELRAQTWYDTVSPAYGLRGFLDDRVNRIMGYAIMRQVRAKRNICSKHKAMEGFSEGCSGYTSILDEDQTNYCANWTRRGSPLDCSRLEYRYSSAGILDNVPFMAKQDVYGGGGYVFPLTGAQQSIIDKMKRLEAENWMDKMTRAVFLEFSVYNAQVNLFGIATIYVEMTPGGGLVPGFRFDAIRLTRQAGSKAFVIVCEVIYCMFIIYFVVRETRLICKARKTYFRHYSVYAEWSIILLSFTGMIVYIMRSLETSSVLDIFKRTYGNGLVNLQYAKTLDNLFGYIVAIIVFIATLKFIKLLRFNRRIGMLSATLKVTWNDLTGFFAIFFIAIGSFALLFHLLLVSHMEDFKSYLSSAESCFAMMMGKFEFMLMYRSSFPSAIAFFFFALYMNLIFVNVLLTIILKGFEQVKNDITKQPNDYEVVDFVVRRFKRFFGMSRNTVIPLKDITAEHKKEMEQEIIDGQKVEELPDKVSEFMDQLNQMYFGGDLNLNDKKVLKRTLRVSKGDSSAGGGGTRHEGRPKSMRNFPERDANHLSQAEQELDDV